MRSRPAVIIVRRIKEDRKVPSSFHTVGPRCLILSLRAHSNKAKPIRHKLLAVAYATESPDRETYTVVPDSETVELNLHVSKPKAQSRGLRLKVTWFV
jgi:hypothetical protein